MGYKCLAAIFMDCAAAATATVVVVVDIVDSTSPSPLFKFECSLIWFFKNSRKCGKFDF